MARTDVHWTEDTSRLPHRIEQLESGAGQRRNLDRALLRLYWGRPLSVPATDVRRPSAALQAIDDTKIAGISLNRQVIDAAAALVVRLPAIRVLPVGQQFKLQRGARLMTRFLNGVFYDNQVKRRAPALFIDKTTTRGGPLKWYVDKKARKIRCERLNSLWLYWDDAEGPEPRELHYVAPASRRWLAAQYPERAEDIMAAPAWNPPGVPTVEFTSAHERDTVKVIESWALGSGPKHPGKHILQLEGKNGRGTKGIDLIEPEAYPHERFPVVMNRWADGYRTFGGRPLGEILMPYQLWTNKVTRIMAESSEAAIPFILMHENAEVTEIQNRVLRKLLYRGAVPPKIEAPQTISVDLWRLRELIKAEAYEEAGVNQQVAQGRTGEALVSAPAQRERMDIASTRLIHPTEIEEAFWRECAEVITMLASTSKHIRARHRVGSWMDEIPWEEIGLAEGESVIEVQSTAALPLTVSGRLDHVNDLLQMKDNDGAALIKARDGLKMIGIADTDTILDRETAVQSLADHQVEQALWEGKYIAPDPIQQYQNGLELLIHTASTELMQALCNGTFPAENLELCRRLIAQAKLLQKGSAAPAPAAAPGPGVPAPAAPPAAPPGGDAMPVGATPAAA